MLVPLSTVGVVMERILDFRPGTTELGNLGMWLTAKALVLNRLGAGRPRVNIMNAMARLSVTFFALGTTTSEPKDGRKATCRLAL